VRAAVDRGARAARRNVFASSTGGLDETERALAARSAAAAGGRALSLRRSRESTRPARRSRAHLGVEGVAVAIFDRCSSSFHALASRSG